MSDDVWRPGGSIDADGGDDDTEAGSGWNSAPADDDSSQAQSNNPFGDSNGTTGGEPCDDEIGGAMILFVSSDILI